MIVAMSAFQNISILSIFAGSDSRYELRKRVELCCWSANNIINFQLFHILPQHNKLKNPRMYQSSEDNINNDNEIAHRYLNVSLPEIREIDRFVLDAPRQLPTKSYSLAPDMATGWKPKKTTKINFQNVFPLNFLSNVNDTVVRNLMKKNAKYELVYLGPRKSNSYQLHEHREYENPYSIDKKAQAFLQERPGVKKHSKLSVGNLRFDSDFECGNLDIAVKVNEAEYDLFMRVDSNTRGHTNWFYFTAQNDNWVGSIKFNICNFRRERSLYQRGMKPFVRAAKDGNEWSQRGYNIEYEKKSSRYKFLYEQEEGLLIESQITRLSTYYTMTFTYNFDAVGDKVEFAYCIPYSYSNLLNFIKEICSSPVLKYETGWRTLSGLPVPLLQITDFQSSQLNKKVVLVTARIHPGQSNSSFVCQGLIKALLSEEGKNRELLKKFHYFIIPMLNPDGVVAGNYRTSLFGKDLNRTFNQSRKYAFPEVFSFIEFAKNLKKQHKQRFTIYLDLHGHSVKKNIFFYGPEYSISHSFYTKSRQFAKILGNITPMFRYYSCIFHISSQKQTTARATLNKVINIPFTYTVQSSNGAFFDSLQHQEKFFVAKHWVEMGENLVRGLVVWAQNQYCRAATKLKKSSYVSSSDEEEEYEGKKLSSMEPPGKQKMSDDELEEGKSDSEPEDQDLLMQQLQKLEKQIEGKTEQLEISPKKQQKRDSSPQKSQRPRNNLRNEIDWVGNLRDSFQRKNSVKNKKQRLPPINLQSNPIQFVSNTSHKKRITIMQALKNLTSSNLNPIMPERRKRLSISQNIINEIEPMTGQESDLILEKKMSKQEILDKLKKKR